MAERFVRLFPFTLSGLVLAGGSLFATIGLGLGREDRVLGVVGIGGLLLLTISLVSTAAGAWWTRRLFRTAFPLQDRLTVGLERSVSSPIRLPPLLDLRWTVQHPEVDVRLVRRGRRLEERWRPRRRGQYDRVVRLVQVGDPFGLCAVVLRIEQPADLEIVPGETALQHIELLHGLTGGDGYGHPEGTPTGDRYDLRPYAPGDPIRLVVWKVYARSRTLVVRTPERAICPDRRTAAYLVASPDDPCAAATVRTLVERGLLGRDWILGCDGVDGPIRSTSALLPALLRSAEHPADESGSGLLGFVQHLEPSDRVLVFVAGTHGPWERALRGVRDRGVALTIVLCADRIVPPRHRALPLHLLLRPSPPPPGLHLRRDALDQLARAVAPLGPVMVLERSTGSLHALHAGIAA